MGLGIKAKAKEAVKWAEQRRNERKLNRLLGDSRYRSISPWIKTWYKHPFNRWAMNTFDLFQVYDLILKIKPAYCVEYGTATGLSSVVMATALRDLGGT